MPGGLITHVGLIAAGSVVSGRGQPGPARLFRLVRWLVLAAVFVCVGYGWGNLSRTIDIYRQSGPGDFVNLPRSSESFASGDAVFVHYPGGADIMIRPSPARLFSPANMWFSAMLPGGGLTISCAIDANPPSIGASMMGNDKLDSSQGRLFLKNATARTPIDGVRVSGTTLSFDRAATLALLDFLAVTSFPDPAWIEADDGTKFGRRLFEIPTFGIQNPVAEDNVVTPWSMSKRRIAEPASDPYRVLATFCHSS